MSRLGDAWRALEHEQRLAAVAALGLFASMFLPWYSKTDTLVVHGAVRATETSLSAFQAFSLVEAAVLLVSASLLAMLFARAERRPFQLPGGDGLIVMLAGGWSALLIFYRLIDKPGLQGNDRVTATVGVEWGIFVALLLALTVLYAGRRMRALETPAPPLRRAQRTRTQRRGEGPLADSVDARAADVTAGGDRWTDSADPVEAQTTVIARRARRAGAEVTRASANPPEAQTAGRASRSRSRYPPAPQEQQLSFEDQLQAPGEP
jgi:membrane protein implicated in regulation of membrane protease activity